MLSVCLYCLLVHLSFPHPPCEAVALQLNCKVAFAVAVQNNCLQRWPIFLLPPEQTEFMLPEGKEKSEDSCEICWRADFP